MPEQLRHSPLRNSVVDLYVANFNGATQNTSFGFSQVPSVDYQYLINKAKIQINKIIQDGYSKFLNDFINYQDGLILCVNTTNLLSKSEYKTSNAFSDSLRFTVVKMPGEFVNVNKSKLSSPYQYGERLRVSASFEKKSDTRQKDLIYRDTNIKGRSKTGSDSTGGVGVGVWS
jgi:hypothetical protein